MCLTEDHVRTDYFRPEYMQNEFEKLSMAKDSRTTAALVVLEGFSLVLDGFSLVLDSFSLEIT